MDSSQQVQPPTKDTEYTGYDAWERHWFQHLRWSWKNTGSDQNWIVNALLYDLLKEVDVSTNKGEVNEISE